MMIKKNVSLGLDIYTLRRNVDRLTKLNNSEFKSLTQYYEIISDYSEDFELDEGMSENTGDGDLFGDEDKKKTSN